MTMEPQVGGSGAIWPVDTSEMLGTPYLYLTTGAVTVQSPCSMVEVALFKVQSATPPQPAISESFGSLRIMASCNQVRINSVEKHYDKHGMRPRHAPPPHKLACAESTSAESTRAAALPQCGDLCRTRDDDCNDH
jgi:hypothetical protein